MKKINFKMALGALALVVFLGGCGEKPILEIKGNQLELTISDKEQLSINDIIINSGECQPIRYTFNVDKFWNKLQAEKPEVLFIGALMSKQAIAKEAGLGKEFPEFFYNQKDFEAESEKIQSFYDAVFPKTIHQNQKVRFITNCKEIKQVELITNDDNFSYNLKEKNEKD